MHRVLHRVMPLFVGLIATASSLAAQPLPAPTNPNLKYLSYYFSDGRYGDFSDDVFPYTNMYVAIPDAYDTAIADWQTPFAASLRNAVDADKPIYLMMLEPEDRRVAQCFTWEKILDVAAPFWSHVVYVEVAHEKDLTAAAMENRIVVLNILLGQRGLAPRRVGAIFGPDLILTTTAINAASLDFAAVEAYVRRAWQL